MASSKTRFHQSGTTTLRHLWLAGLGMASLMAKTWRRRGGSVQSR